MIAKSKKPATAPESARKKTPANAWQKGESGNPKGRAPGTRNRATALAEAILERDVESIAEVVTKAAMGGDLQAARLVIERLVPPRRERPISIDLPATDTLDGISAAHQAILDALSKGDLLPSESATLSGIVEQHRKIVESQDLERRIAALEKERAKK